jgi:2-amino-4-hydroxy-6-hydroxymethyldihydropteridine diphosphokinase
MSGMPALAYIGLGANLGGARATLAAAVAALAGLPGCSLLATSPVYRSAPIDSSGPDYLNAVAALHTSLAPHDLLRALQAIEQQHGRQRPYRNAPRTLDLDLLLFDAQVIDSPDLVVPHPRMHGRAFVLLPLADLAPALVIPGRGPVATLLLAVGDQAVARLLS